MGWGERGVWSGKRGVGSDERVVIGGVKKV